MLKESKTKRILFALAVLRLRVDELESFVNYVSAMTPRGLHLILRRIEQDMTEFRIGDEFSKSNEDRFQNSTASQVTDRILLLLRSEAKLERVEIVKGLTELLSKDHGGESLPPFSPKKSLSDWLSTLSKKIGPSTLLHAATVLRNRSVHEQKSPWPLDR
jgi:hypothetical protein